MEKELGEVIPEERWIEAQDLLAFHGRAKGKASEPECTGCPLDDLCYFPE